jgi:hypothetical protein
MHSTKIAKYSNRTNLGTINVFPTFLTYTDPTATSEYGAAKISGIVIGIFAALLILYGIWQNGGQCIGQYNNSGVFKELILRSDRFA